MVGLITCQAVPQPMRSRQSLGVLNSEFSSRVQSITVCACVPKIAFFGVVHDVIQREKWRKTSRERISASPPRTKESNLALKEERKKEKKKSKKKPHPGSRTAPVYHRQSEPAAAPETADTSRSQKPQLEAGSYNQPLEPLDFANPTGHVNVLYV
ncbi:hypothetical protein FPV67DRAFT_1453458 [Lyophyllum atratum]|nr:hypothetical protein FPV67DRAFT_1453458 [Lyophyllum atratum]